MAEYQLVRVTAELEIETGILNFILEILCYNCSEPKIKRKKSNVKKHPG